MTCKARVPECWSCSALLTRSQATRPPCVTSVTSLDRYSDPEGQRKPVFVLSLRTGMWSPSQVWRVPQGHAPAPGKADSPSDLSFQLSTHGSGGHSSLAPQAEAGALLSDHSPFLVTAVQGEHEKVDVASPRSPRAQQVPEGSVLACGPQGSHTGKGTSQQGPVEDKEGRGQPPPSRGHSRNTGWGEEEDYL